ncbi:MAG: hypothetical protein D4R84_08700 [Rhodocyclaceae bacterium]|nr:MAG: hypothetical protein D4R84_08700 [Rhodocyclaceae bacterium]
MKHLRTTLLLFVAVLPAPTFSADAEAGLLAIKALGSVNGQALACADTKLAARAKELMLAHAPKTQRFGAAYEEATQEAFLAQTRAAGTCPDTTYLTDRLNQLALRLADTLPVVAPAAK